jgi:hypothetical protein
VKVLFVTCKAADYISSVLWDGLCEVLGPQNVYDAIHSPQLHPVKGEDSNRDPNTAVGRHPGAIANYLRDENGFEIMVMNAAFFREGSMGQAERFRALCRQDAAMIYVNGDDGTDWGVTPPWPIDAFFRREMVPGFPYPGNTHPITMAAPRRWFVEMPVERDIDFLHAGWYMAHPARWQIAQKMFSTQRRHHSLCATQSIIPYSYWFSMLRRTKFCICPPGAGSDCLRQWEALACGAIPIFVDHPDRLGDLHPQGTITIKDVDELPALMDTLMDRVLGYDMTGDRRAMWENALAKHTTAARARQVLRSVNAYVPV